MKTTIEIKKTGKCTYYINGEKINGQNSRFAKLMKMSRSRVTFRAAFCAWLEAGGLTWQHADRLYCLLHNKFFSKTFAVIEAAGSIHVFISPQFKNAWTSLGGMIQ